MGLLENLGLAGIFGGAYPPDWQARQQQFMQYYPTCIHGLYCSVCREQAENAFKLARQNEELLAKQKLDYQNRCKIYMEKFRANHKLSKQ